MAASYQPESSTPPTPPATPRLLYLGVTLFLLATLVTGWTVYRAWSQERALSRARAVVELVGVRTPTRPTGTPGAVAWLDHQVRVYGLSHQAGEGAPAHPGWSEHYPFLLEDPSDELAVRPPFDGIASILRPAGDLASAAPGTLRFADLDEAPREPLALRVQRYLAYAPAPGEPAPQDRLVLTRRRVLDAPLEDLANTSNAFLHHLVPHLRHVRDHLTGLELPRLSEATRPRIDRVYALAEDGTFVSLPFDGNPHRPDPLRDEGRVFRKQPRLPTFVSNEFFFRFDFDRPAVPQAFFSGLYLDLGGLGLVTTLAVPILEDRPGLHGVAGVDVTLPIDWRDFATSIRPPLAAAVAELESPTPGGWQPWQALRDALAPSGDREPAVERALLDVLEILSELDEVPALPVHHGEVEGHGTLVAFQVTRDEWLAVLFPEIETQWPWPAFGLLSLLGLALVAGFEHNRRKAERAQARAEHEQAKAEREFQEKQNLLNTMRVPLSVVDPNTDRVVYGNDAAQRLGITAGSCIGDLVDDDPRALEHYRRMQGASLETRRAYGVPLRLPGEDGLPRVRHAIIRSVAVKAPIESLHADERHRLGILFVVEPEADLALWSADLERRARGEERAHLADLLSHGVTHLARLLRQRLRAGVQAGDDFTVWLADYLARRLEVAAWLLGHWHAEPPLSPAVTVEAGQVRATLEHFQRVFAFAREDAALRERLHWSNGVLAGGEPGASGEVFEVRGHWPESHLFTCPVRGGAGLFLEEVLVNAIKHGRPGSRPRLTLDLDPARRELLCEALNPAEPSRPDAGLKPYGGRRLLTRLAFLFGWRDLRFERAGDDFRVSWRVPVSERAAPGETD